VLGQDRNGCPFGSGIINLQQTIVEVACKRLPVRQGLKPPYTVSLPCLSTFPKKWPRPFPWLG
jgi:hypothetical protein